MADDQFPLDDVAFDLELGLMKALDLKDLLSKDREKQAKARTWIARQLAERLRDSNWVMNRGARAPEYSTHPRPPIAVDGYEVRLDSGTIHHIESGFLFRVVGKRADDPILSCHIARTKRRDDGVPGAVWDGVRPAWRAARALRRQERGDGDG
jgi:hypothetical protein